MVLKIDLSMVCLLDIKDYKTFCNQILCRFLIFHKIVIHKVVKHQSVNNTTY